MGRGLRMIGFDHVNAFKDRHGKTRYRFRRKGSKAVYLPGLPGSPEFAQAYADAVAGVTSRLEVGAGRTVPGTINALAVAIYASAEWHQLAPTTKCSRRGIIEALRRDYGDFRVATLKQGHVRTMRDKKRGTPAAANNFLKVLRWMMTFAVERNLRPDNPVVGIKPLRIESDGFHTWTEDEVAQFEAHWPVGTRERLAFDLLLYTVQRSGDVRQMGRQHIRQGRLHVVQDKTGARLSLLIREPLAASLATVPQDQMMFVVTAYGQPFTAKGFGNWFSAACRDAGLPHCSAHGLRKCGATRLADAGCSDNEIMAWTGHKSPKELQTYTRARNQSGLADSAITRLNGTKGEQNLANPTTRLAK
jgi:integrase